MRAHRTTTALVAIAAVALLALGTAADGASSPRPAIRFADGVPDDVRQLALGTWDRFLAAFPARTACLPDVTLATAWTYSRKGHYDPELRVVTIRIPGTAPNLSATMVHEFAHHLDFSCPDRPLREAFLADQGLPADGYWRHARRWEAVPAEQFAQAVIPVVLGPQPDLGVVVRPAAIRDIRAWGRGR